MALAVSGVLRETREYYLAMKREAISRVIVNGYGALVRKKRGERVYAILRRRHRGKLSDVHLGPSPGEHESRISESLAATALAKSDLRKARQAMKELGMPSSQIENEDFVPLLATIFERFEQAGLWEHGLELIGSWCFKAYQIACGVEYYPERTLDVDFALPVPYPGPDPDMSDLLRGLGFQERLNYADGSVVFVAPDLKLEFLTDRKGDGHHRDLARAQSGSSAKTQDLGLAPVAMPYMRILLNNPVRMKVYGLGTVAVPSMAAFFWHKLLVADERKDQTKKAKDYRQAEAVAKVLAADPARRVEAADIAASLHKKWLAKAIKSAVNMQTVVPGTGPASLALIELAGV